MILVVGAGSIGKRHLGNLVGCAEREFVVADPREDRRNEAVEQVRRAFDALESDRKRDAPPNVVIVRFSEEAYAQGLPIDSVVIAAPPRFHSEEVRRALKAGAHVFCEKPLATDDESWDDLTRLIDEVEAAGLLGMVGYNYRFCPHLQTARQMLREGAVGRVLSVRGTFSQNLRDWHPWEGLNFFMSSRAAGGGTLLEESHLVDMCRWLFGEIVDVMGYNGTVSSLKEEPSCDVDDLVEMIVHFRSMAVGSLHMDLYGRYHQKRLEVIGEEGTLFWEYDGTDVESNTLQLWKGKRVRMSPEFSRRLPELSVSSDWQVRNAMYLDEIRYFLESRNAGRHLRSDVPDLRDGLQTLAVLRAARRASVTRRLETVESVLATREEPVEGSVIR